MERKTRIVQIDGVEHHHCGKCKQYKLPEEFYANKRSLSGRGSYCKPCMREYSSTEEWSEWRKQRYYKNPARTIWMEAKSRARKLQIPFDLEPEDCQIPEFCPVLGIKLSGKGFGTKSETTPTLDRMNNLKGYVKGNVKVISWKANRLKSDCNDPQTFLAIAEYVRNCNSVHT